MGCNESKHDVATGNTIKKSNACESKNSKDIETVLETGNNDNNNNSLVQQEGENVNNNTEVDNVVAGADIKDIGENKAKEEEHAEPGSLVSKESPNRFFSSRKDEEALEGIVSEGRSDKSEYYSPRVEAGKESLFNENVKVDDVVEEKKLIEESKEETKNEASNVNEENLVKEAEVATTTTEAEVSTPSVEEKSLNAD